ncbi:MAG: helicase-related protein [Candidatus Wallbacteria bacterium]|nr:helicase-related protein [Candidatus Wallbacteria bacterium]
MPRIFDNIEHGLLEALRTTITVSERADFCVGYFNLRGWKQIDSFVEQWQGGEGHCCRLLVGMQQLPEDDLKASLSLFEKAETLDRQTIARLKKKIAQDFKEQLCYGAPSATDEIGLRRLAAQIRNNKVVIKLFLRHQLHAKLYLLFRPDPVNPKIGYLGSSNLTFAGLANQGELNVELTDCDTCEKLALWFEDRWNDNQCIDISKELLEIIEESWARSVTVPPYHIYLKIAYHLSYEAREGLQEFKIPAEFDYLLFDFQKAAVKIAAHHINKRGGVLIGDVVGLGKTLMAAAVAKIIENDFDLETLIICPKNLVGMWEHYREKYKLKGKVLSISQFSDNLELPRLYRLILIDESHNLRNKGGKRYKAIQDYIHRNDCRCILLSATPYNKTYLDLSNQLRLFIEEDTNLGIRPEKLLRSIGEPEFKKRHQCPIHSISAFEKSEFPDDWRDLMRLYLVRRTRSFIQDNYAETDPESKRKYLTFSDGTRSYFPERIPKTVRFKNDENSKSDLYARLYSQDVVDTINSLTLPRYGLGNYIIPGFNTTHTTSEDETIKDLSRAGKRLMGFCRTNLFKRLESSGYSFLLSLERHILRNYVYLHALENHLVLPLGTQDIWTLDSRNEDEDNELGDGNAEFFETEMKKKKSSDNNFSVDEDVLKERAQEIYETYRIDQPKRFKWLRSELFDKALIKDLKSDSKKLLLILQNSGKWDSRKDNKLKTLFELLEVKHASQKILVFTQFADTVRYLEKELKNQGITCISGVTGDCDDPTSFAIKFSPVSNEKRGKIKPEDELRVLIATDVLSEGQNLQDCSIVVNYDLPWAIIRLIQRVGRVDRIGQKAESISCYSFLPADGVEKIIKLRSRVKKRLQENAEVVGTDESFFEDEGNEQIIMDLYSEKSGILDEGEDNEVDLGSYAYQIWKNAIDKDPKIEKTVRDLPQIIYSSKPFQTSAKEPEGILAYFKTENDNDTLVWMDRQGTSVTESQLAILKAAECLPDTPALERMPEHHDLVKSAVKLVIEEEKTQGGQLGRASGAKFKVYERLKHYGEETQGTLFEPPNLDKVLKEIFRFPFRQIATDILNRQIRSGLSDQELVKLVYSLREEDRLCIVEEDQEPKEPKIICSMGLMDEKQENDR